MSHAPAGPLSRAILIVEDDPEIANILAAVVQEDGHTVTIVTSGSAGLALAASLPALIVLDVGLPDMDGLEVCRQLRTDGPTAHIPVVFVTGSAEALTPERLAGCRPAAILAKPVDLDHLLATVRQHLVG